MTSAAEPKRGLTIPGFEPLPDDDDPLGQFDACHGRMQRQLTTLERLLARQRDPARCAEGALVADDAVTAAAAVVVRYFDEAAPNHHRDEEDDLLPALIEAMAGSDAVCLRALANRVGAEHRELERRWAVLRPTVAALARGENRRLDDDVVAAFVAAHRQHLALEDDEVLPLARRLLSDAQVASIGDAMRERRGRD